MNDPLDNITKALKAAPPAPDPGLKSAHLLAAQAAFAEEFQQSHQESTAPARPTSNRSIWAAAGNGVLAMIDRMTTRAGLAVTSGMLTAGVALVLILPQDDLRSPDFGLQTLGNDEPIVEPTAALGTSASAPAQAEEAAQARVRTTAPVTELAESDADALALSDTMAERELSQDIVAAPRQMLKQNSARSESVVTLQAAPAPAMVAAPERMRSPEQKTEQFANAQANPVTPVAESPVSTFSVDVDTASYAIVRSSLLQGYLPPAEAVRVEEMVNYFPYDYPAPQSNEAPFRPSISVTGTPWNKDTQLLHIALQGQTPEIANRPPLNLVFLIDTSGSMSDANKLPLLKQSLRLMLGQLRPEDEVAIVTYAGSAGQVLAPTPAGEEARILAALDQLDAGGSTAGQAGLEQAYALAASMTDEGDVSRVLLATDGDFNVGISDPEALKTYVERKRTSGTYLSVLGFGRGNLNDALMQSLAQNGNGQAAYIDTIAEAQKVLVDQLTGAMFPIASDVKVQVEFNPDVIAEYRLIGYETRALAREDFNNDKVDAGEIGAGHQVTALYEVTPVGSPAVLNTPLRYGSSESTDAQSDKNGELGFLRLRYKEPGASSSKLIEMPIPARTEDAGQEQRFAMAVAGFGQLLRGSDYLRDWSYGDAIALANGARGDDPYGYRAEAVRLMRLAESLSN